jgi:acyl dehydratase
MAITRIVHGHLYEDFEVGRVFKHHWGRTLTQTDNVLFCSLTMQYNPLYTNAEYARKLGYETCPIHPLLVAVTSVGLSVEDLTEAGGPFLGIDDMKLAVPVYAGDTVTAESAVLERRLSASRPGWGIVSWRTRSFNQRKEQVIEYKRTNLSRTRDAK